MSRFLRDIFHEMIRSLRARARRLLRCGRSGPTADRPSPSPSSVSRVPEGGSPSPFTTPSSPKNRIQHEPDTTDPLGADAPVTIPNDATISDSQAELSDRHSEEAQFLNPDKQDAPGAACEQDGPSPAVSFAGADQPPSSDDESVEPADVTGSDSFRHPLTEIIAPASRSRTPGATTSVSAELVFLDVSFGRIGSGCPRRAAP